MQTGTADVQDVNLTGYVIQQQPLGTGEMNGVQATLLDDTGSCRNPWDSSGRTVNAIIGNGDEIPLKDPEEHTKERQKRKWEPTSEPYYCFDGLCGPYACCCCDCSGHTVDTTENNDDPGCCCSDQDGCCDGEECDCGGCGGDCGDCGDCTIL